MTRGQNDRYCRKWGEENPGPLFDGDDGDYSNDRGYGDPPWWGWVLIVIVLAWACWVSGAIQ